MYRLSHMLLQDRAPRHQREIPGSFNDGEFSAHQLNSLTVYALDGSDRGGDGIGFADSAGQRIARACQLSIL